MFFVIPIPKTLVINPKWLGKGLKMTLEIRLRELVEGTVSGRYGYIICVIKYF